MAGNNKSRRRGVGGTAQRGARRRHVTAEHLEERRRMTVENEQNPMFCRAE